MAPIVVQGTAVSNPNSFGASTSPAAPSGGNQHGEHQGTKCNDPIFAALGIANIIAMVAVASIFGNSAFEGDLNADDNDNSNGNDANNDSGSGNDYIGFVYIAVILIVLSFIGSGFGVMILMCIPSFIIKASIIFTVLMSILWLALCVLSGLWPAAIFAAILLGCTLCYARAVWPRIPFATANLKAATAAIRANFGVVFLSYFFTILAGLWSFVWTVAVVGIIVETSDCPEGQDQAAQDSSCGEPSYIVLFFLFLSYFFTHQIIQNSIHVTIAGTVGTWWVAPDESGCCSSGVINSFIRTMTTSFGSICFGSLLVAIIQALRALADSARENGDSDIIACVASCILGCLESILEYFNKWAFIYVGVYGYSYIEAGKNVFNLFRDRGWEAIIADDLVDRALFLVSLIVGGVVGGIGVFIESQSDWLDDTNIESPGAIAFVLGFFIGLVMCSIMLSSISSAVNTVIVMFADAPAEFDRNHPEHAAEMKSTWRELYPGSI